MSFFSGGDDFGYSITRTKKKRSLGALLLLVFGLGFFAVWAFPTPYVIEQPGPTFNVLGMDEKTPVITISGAPSYATSGHLDLLTVQIVGNREKTPSWFEIAAAWNDPSRNVLPIDQVYPANQTTEQSKAESSAMMEQSQQEAIAAALNKLGYKVPVYVYISEVQKDSPSSGQLIAADFVREVNGSQISSIEELRAQVNKYDGTHPLHVVVQRKGKEVAFDLNPIKDTDGKWRLGILVGYKYEFPVDVKLQLADVGGPSGGAMFALGIYDKLTPGELTGGKYIAGTGTISASGAVGPIGGVQQKMYGASAAGAKYFLAPTENCREVNGHIPAGLSVFSVSTFDQALAAVEAIGADKDLSKLPTCATK